MDVSQIFPNLFVGSFPRTGEDVERLKQEFGITAVLNVQSEKDLAHWSIDWSEFEADYQQAGIAVRRVPVQDFDQDDLRRNLPRCVEALHQLLEAGHTVYVHCTAGVNRSPSTIIAYLHWMQGWELYNAAEHVARCHFCSPYLDVIQLAGEDRIGGGTS